MISLNPSGSSNFRGNEPSVLFVDYFIRSSVRGDKSIEKLPQGTDLASQYQSISSDPRPNFALSVVTWNTPRGCFKRLMCGLWSLISQTSLFR